MYESGDIVSRHLMAYVKIYKHTATDFVFLHREDHEDFIAMIKEIYRTSTLPTPFIYVHCRILFCDIDRIRNISPLLTNATFTPPERFLCGIREKGIIKGIELGVDSTPQERMLLIRES